MISTDLRRAGPYTTNGVQTEFEFSFKVFEAEDLLVLLALDGEAEEEVESGDYSVALNPDQDFEPGGAITFDVAPAAGKMSILSDMPTEQPAVFTNTGNFYPRVLNDSLDRATISIQQLEEQLTRTPIAPVTSDDQLGWIPVLDGEGGFVYVPASDFSGEDPTLRVELASSLGGKGASMIGTEQGFDLQEVVDGVLRYSSPELQGYASGDATAAILAAIAEAVAEGHYTLLLSARSYTVSDQITVPHNFTIISFGSKLVGSVTEALLYVGSETVTAIPDLAGDETVGDPVVSFAAAHGLAVGDVGCVYNPTDYSWSSSRSYYRAGEMFEVDKVTSSTQVRLTAGLMNSYTAASVDCYKLTTGTFNIIGQLTVQSTQPAPGDRTVAVKLCQVANSNIDGLIALGLGNTYAAVEMVRCYKVQLSGRVKQSGVSVDGDAYGLVISNCQQIITRTHCSSTGHALSHGGNTGAGCVPNRDIQNFGTWETTAEGVKFAVDAHGNCERVHFNGTAKGGMSLGGASMSVAAGSCVLAETTIGVCLNLGEVKRPDFTFSGVKFFGNAVDPAVSTNAVISIGANGEWEVDDMESGTLRFDGIEIHASSATRGVSARRQNSDTLAGAKHSIDLRGARILINGGGIPVYVDDVTNTLNWDRVNLTDADIPGLDSVIIEADRIQMPSQEGAADIAYTTSIATLDVAVVFPMAFPAGYRPKILAFLEDAKAIGATPVDAIVNTVSNTGFTLTARTYNAANFGATITQQFIWEAW